VFFNCLVNSWCTDYDAYLAGLGFRPSEFVDALNEAIVTPRAHAQDIVERHAKLTRLFTTMSAGDMTEDPVFYPSVAAREVSNIHTARLITECDARFFYYTAPQKMILPSGREVRTREGIVYPGSDAMYCEDRGSGAFSPWTPIDRLRETADLRSRAPIAARGGGICSASHGAGGSAAGQSRSQRSRSSSRRGDDVAEARAPIRGELSRPSRPARTRAPRGGSAAWSAPRSPSCRPGKPTCGRRALRSRSGTSR